jgi:hypothetical protein
LEVHSYLILVNVQGYFVKLSFILIVGKLNPVNCIWICIAMGSNDPG